MPRYQVRTLERTSGDLPTLFHVCTGLGGGILEGVFVLPVLLLVVGLVIAVRRRLLGPLKTALYASSSAYILLFVLAVVAASTNSLYPPGP